MDGFLMSIIIIYALFNIGWFIWYSFRLAEYCGDIGAIDILLPTLGICEDIADEYYINVVGKYVMLVLYTIFVFPAIVLSCFIFGLLYLLYLMAKVCYLIFDGFRWIFRKR